MVGSKVICDEVLDCWGSLNPRRVCDPSEEGCGPSEEGCGPSEEGCGPSEEGCGPSNGVIFDDCASVSLWVVHSITCRREVEMLIQFSGLPGGS